MGQSCAFGRGWGRAGAPLGAASMAALAVLGLVPATGAPLMATLAGSSGQPNFVAAVTATGDSLVVVPATLLTNDPRAIELWLILPNQRPRSLGLIDRKSTRLNSSHANISYAVFCLKKKKKEESFKE